MQVRVLAVGARGDRIVRVATTEGEAEVEWVGDLPDPGEVVDVELEIEDRLVLDRTVFKVSRNRFQSSLGRRRRVQRVVLRDDDGGPRGYPDSPP